MNRFKKNLSFPIEAYYVSMDASDRISVIKISIVRLFGPGNHEGMYQASFIKEIWASNGKLLSSITDGFSLRIIDPKTVCYDLLVVSQAIQKIKQLKIIRDKKDLKKLRTDAETLINRGHAVMIESNRLEEKLQAVENVVVPSVRELYEKS